MRMRIAITILATTMLCGGAAAADKQIWACRTAGPQSQPILHLVEWGPKSYVKFANVRVTARYQIDDEQRGWYWSNEGNGYYRYGLVLEPDGKAWYHDFSRTDENGLSEALDQFSCRQTS